MSMTKRANRQVRNFVLIWTALTVLMGACTFAAIFTAYGILDESEIAAIQPTQGSDTGIAASNELPTQNFPTRLPTDAPVIVTATSDEVTSAQSIASAEPTEIVEAVVIEPSETPIPSATPTVLPVNDKSFQLGIQIQVNIDGFQDAWMNELDKLNMDWMKQQVRWEFIEPEPGQYDWTPLDIGINLAAERGKKVMLSIVTAPDWARETGVDLSQHGPPANDEDYVNFIREILTRYKGRVHAIEIWNEQNLDREWTSTRGLVPSDYVNMLRLSYQAIKEIDPGIIVISGALSPTGFDDRIGAWNDFAYMEAMIEAGLLNYSDCIGAHHNGYNVSPIYTWDNIPNDPTATFRGPFDNPHHSWSFQSTLRGYDFRVKQAGGDQKLCVTEFGWPVTEDLDGFPPGFEFANDNTLAEQSEFTVQALDLMVELDIVQIAFLWNLNYGAQAGWDPTNDNVPYSIIGKDYNNRPVYAAVSEWMANYRSLEQ